MAKAFNDKTFIITGGKLYAPLDSDHVRRYVNMDMLPELGVSVAKEATLKGARVIMVTPPGDALQGFHANVTNVTSVDGHDIATCEDMQQAVEKLLTEQKVDAVAYLASQPAFGPVTVHEGKEKAKTEAGAPKLFEVVAAPDYKKLFKKAAGDSLPVFEYEGCAPYVGGEPKYADWTGTLRRVIEEQKEWCATHVPPMNFSPVRQAASGPLKGKKVLITAGPTYERMTTNGDAITNGSTGSQAYVLAEQYLKAGAEVTIVSGPTPLPVPSGAKLCMVTSAAQMRTACDDLLKYKNFDIAVGVAAVADFGMDRPVDLAFGRDGQAVLTLQQNPDVIQSIANHVRRPKVVIGFAAESTNVVYYAQNKLAAKHLDAILGNEANSMGKERESQSYWITQHKVEKPADNSKLAVAELIVLNSTAMLAARGRGR